VIHFLRTFVFYPVFVILTQVIDYLVQKGANLNARDTAGRSALHIASMLGFAPTVLYLVVKAGANVEAKDNNLLSPLHLAAGTDHISTMKVN
jgi:ankyrin repeat protein